MHLKVGDLVAVIGINKIFVVHTLHNEVFTGFIGITDIETGKTHQYNTTFVVKLKTDKK